MPDVSISFEFIWEEQDADCSKCDVCDDVIVDKKYSLLYKVNDNPFFILDGEIDVCKGCVDAINSNSNAS